MDIFANGAEAGPSFAEAVNTDIAALMDELAADPAFRIKDRDLLNRGITPDYLNRLYRDTFGLNFQDFLRMRRLNTRFGAVRYSLEAGEGLCVGAKRAEASAGIASVTGGSGVDTGNACGISSTDSARPSVVDKRIVVNRFDTPLGPVMAAASTEGICLLEFAERRMMEKQMERLERADGIEIIPGTSPLFALLVEELDSYFRGHLREFSVPLDIRGTPFQKKVWEELQRIRWGETRSYAEEAKALGDLKAVRAVARANSENPIAILIPCHRVIGSNGSLTGYAGGLWRKEFLLRLESSQGELF